MTITQIQGMVAKETKRHNEANEGIALANSIAGYLQLIPAVGTAIGSLMSGAAHVSQAAEVERHDKEMEKIQGEHNDISSTGNWTGFWGSVLKGVGAGIAAGVTKNILSNKSNNNNDNSPKGGGSGSASGDVDKFAEEFKDILGPQATVPDHLKVKSTLSLFNTESMYPNRLGVDNYSALETTTSATSKTTDTTKWAEGFNGLSQGTRDAWGNIADAIGKGIQTIPQGITGGISGTAAGLGALATFATWAAPLLAL